MPPKYRINSADSDYSDEDERSSLIHSGRNGSYYTTPISQEMDAVVEILQAPFEGTQKSYVTVFNFWNTMMGTSLLSMPWALGQSGFILGIILLIGMAALMNYTSYLVVATCKKRNHTDFDGVVQEYLGRALSGCALVCSLLVLLGGCIVYWILLSNFLYHIGIFVYTKTHDANITSIISTCLNGTFMGMNVLMRDQDTNPEIFWRELAEGNSSDPLYPDALCVSGSNHSDAVPLPPCFAKYWDLQNTIPFFLIPMIALYNFKTNDFFVKFNMMGTFSCTVMTILVTYKAANWGFHLDLSPADSDLPSYSSSAESTFPALTGVAALAFFLQNCVMSISEKAEKPEQVPKLVSIGYTCVCVTYVYMGVIFFSSFPLTKSCIADNFLNNFPSTDPFAFVGRIVMFLSMASVLPMLLFVMRQQFMKFFFGRDYPSVWHVIAINIVVVAISVTFAVVYPNIGRIISFVGAFCGFSYAIALPCICYLLEQRREGVLTWKSIIFHSALMVLGGLNFAAQFLVFI